MNQKETLDAGRVAPQPSAQLDEMLHMAPLSPPEIALLIVVGALPLIFLPFQGAAFWVPKWSLLLMTIPPAIFALVRGCRRRSKPALFAAAFLVSAFISMLAADNPLLSFLGVYSWGTGWLFLAGLIGMWAMGAEIGPRARLRLIDVLAFVILANGVMAWLQITVGAPARVMRIDDGGRAFGFMGNAVYLGALTAAGIVLFGAKLAKAKGWREQSAWIGALVVLGGATQLSGGRSAIALAGVATLIAAVLARWIKGGLVIVAVAVGVFAATFAPAHSGSAGNAVERVTGGGGYSARLSLWQSGVESLADSPVRAAVGFGPGRFRVASVSGVSAESVRDRGIDTIDVDSHNIVVEYVTTTGALGFLLAGTFIILCLRKARGPLLWFAAIIGAAALVEPQEPGITALAFVALGASAPGWIEPKYLGRRELRRQELGRARPFEDSMRGRWREAGALGFGATIMLIFVTSAVALATAPTGGNFNIEKLQRAEKYLPNWPESKTMASRLAEAIADQSPGNTIMVDGALHLAYEAAHRDATEYTLWADVGEMEIKYKTPGYEARSQRVLKRALSINPWSKRVMISLLNEAARLDNTKDIEKYCLRLIQIDPEGPCAKKGDSAIFDPEKAEAQAAAEAAGISPDTTETELFPPDETTTPTDTPPTGASGTSGTSGTSVASGATEGPSGAT